MPRRFHLLALTFILLAAVGPIALNPRRAGAFSYIQNGSFEDGTDGWHSNTDLSTVDASAVTPVTGASSARLALNGSSFRMVQSIFGAPPGTYQFSAQVRRTSPATQIYVEALITNPQGDGSGPIEASGVADQWTEVSGQLYLPVFAQVQIAIGGSGSGDVYVDDVHFDGAPPVTATATASPTPTVEPSVTVSPTATRTTTPTKTATVTRTATPEDATAGPLSATLENGGFESGTAGEPDAWRSYGGSLSVSEEHAHSGVRAARLDSATDSTKWIYQPIAIEGGGTYELDAWVAAASPNISSASLRISWYESSDASGQALATSDSTDAIDGATGDYRELTTGAVAAPDTAHSARLRVLLAPASADLATLFVDDVSFGPAAPAEALPATAIPANDANEAPIPPAAPRHAVLAASARPQTLTGSTQAAPTAGGSVVINEVLYDPDVPGSDADAEWLELYNPGAAAVDLGGWSLSDGASAETIPPLRIEPHAFVILSASASFSKRYPGFRGDAVSLGGRIGNGLGNDGDRLVLRDGAGAPIDAISWGADAGILSPSIDDVPAGHSIERATAGADHDRADDFVDNEHPSPGEPIAPSGVKPLHQNGPSSVEVLPAASGSIRRWLPWAIAAASGAALVVAASWRAAPLFTRRLRRSP